MAKFHYRESPTLSQRKAFAAYLSEDEDLVLATGLSRAYIRSAFIIYLVWPGVIFALLAIGIGWLLHFDRIIIIFLSLGLLIAGAILKTMHVYHAHRYLLTTKRVIIKKGLFSVKVTAALYDKITHLEVDQSFLDRILLHHGHIIVNTAGLNKREILLEAVDYPMEIKNLMERLINREREQLGMKSTPFTTVEGEIIS